MKKIDKIKNILIISWPFIGLLIFLIWAWFYIKPMLPKNFISFDKIKNIFQKEEKWTHPDEKYDFFYSHEKLKPKTIEELKLVILNDSEESREGEKNIKVNSVEEIQTAIKNANSGDTIELQSGRYQTNIFVDKDLTIYGQGTSTVLIGGDIGTAIYVENCKFNLSHLMIINSNSAIKTSNASGEIKAVIIKNNQKSGIELRNSKFIIKNNIITANGSYGVFVDASSEAEIFGNYIEKNKGFQVRIEKEKKIYR